MTCFHNRSTSATVCLKRLRPVQPSATSVETHVCQTAVLRDCIELPHLLFALVFQYFRLLAAQSTCMIWANRTTKRKGGCMYSQYQPATPPCVRSRLAHTDNPCCSLLKRWVVVLTPPAMCLWSHRLRNHPLAGCVQSTWPLSRSERLAQKASGVSASSVESWSRFIGLRERKSKSC